MLIVRTFGAVLAGLILMGITVVLVETVGYSTYPVPKSLDDASARYAEAQVASLEGTAEDDEVQGAKETLRAAIADYIETAPTGALLFVVFAWIAGGFVGGAVAALFAPRWKMPIAVLVGAFGVAAIVSTVLDIPHPIWMPVLGIVGTLLAAGFAGIFVSRWSLGRKPKPA